MVKVTTKKLKGNVDIPTSAEVTRSYLHASEAFCPRIPAVIRLEEVPVTVTVLQQPLAAVVYIQFDVQTIDTTVYQEGGR